MPTIIKGEQKQYQVTLAEGSEVQLTLLDWAKTRGIPPGVAIRCIVAEWSDAVNGKRNPFGITLAVPGPTENGQVTTSVGAEVQTAKQKKREKALQEAAAQFF